MVRQMMIYQDKRLPLYLTTYPCEKIRAAIHHNMFIFTDHLFLRP